MQVIGLTGGIASGKSTAAKLLGERGAHVIDADRLGHRAYEPGTGAFDAVVNAFGAGVVGTDGRIDRRALGAQVFGNAARLRDLTDIVWPEIRRLAEVELTSLRTADPDGVAVLEAAVLLEAGWEDAVDEIWVVIVAPEVAVTRAMARDGSDADAVRRRIAAQLSNEERAARAHVIIDNASDVASLAAAVDAEWARVTRARVSGGAN